MAAVSVSEAARLTGKNRKTIQRAVADGKLSKSQDAAGRVSIDVSELERVFGKLSPTVAAQSHGQMSLDVQPSVSDLEARIRHLEAENSELRHTAELAQAVSAERATQIQHITQAMHLLESAMGGEGKQKQEPEKRRWWQFR